MHYAQAPGHAHAADATPAVSWREPTPADLVEASRELALLEARELGLVDSSTRLREMRRTVVIAAANMANLSNNADLGGLFADDRALAGWLGEQLDDDATYLEAAGERIRQVSALTDQLVQRGQQRRQERFNLGLTGVIGAILMSLAAIQSLSYSVPLPSPVKPREWADQVLPARSRGADAEHGVRTA